MTLRSDIVRTIHQMTGAGFVVSRPIALRAENARLQTDREKVLSHGLDPKWGFRKPPRPR